MSEAGVGLTHQESRAPLTAAGPAAWLVGLLLLAAGCSAADEPQKVGAAWNPGGAIGGGSVRGAAGRGAGVGVPGTAGTPVGAGTGQPITTAGAAPAPSAGAGAGVAGSAPPPTAGGPVGPVGGTGGPISPVGGTGGTVPPSDGGLPEFNAGTDPARNRVQAGQLCARASAIQCAAEAHCCPKPTKALEACKSQLTMACTMQLYLDDIARNNAAGFNPTQAEAVFNKLEEFSRACDPNITLWIPKPEGLASMFQGTVPPNGTCKPTGFASGGSFGGALASCTQSTTNACLFTGPGTPPTQPQSATCAVRADAGATCFAASNCKDGLYCANPQNTYSGGKCTASKATGQPCSADAECQTFTCRSGVCLVPNAQSAYCVSN